MLYSSRAPPYPLSCLEVVLCYRSPGSLPVARCRKEARKPLGISQGMTGPLGVTPRLFQASTMRVRKAVTYRRYPTTPQQRRLDQPREGGRGLDNEWLAARREAGEHRQESVRRADQQGPAGTSRRPCLRSTPRARRSRRSTRRRGATSRCAWIWRFTPAVAGDGLARRRAMRAWVGRGAPTASPSHRFPSVPVGSRRFPLVVALTPGRTVFASPASGGGKSSCAAHRQKRPRRPPAAAAAAGAAAAAVAVSGLSAARVRARTRRRCRKRDSRSAVTWG
jgi:hypothetical protein